MDWGEGQGCGERTIKAKFTEMLKIHNGETGVVVLKLSWIFVHIFH